MVGITRIYISCHSTLIKCRDESGLQRKKRKSNQDPGVIYPALAEQRRISTKTQISAYRLNTVNESWKNPGNQFSATVIINLLPASPKSFLFGFYVLA